MERKKELTDQFGNESSVQSSGQVVQPSIADCAKALRASYAGEPWVYEESKNKKKGVDQLISMGFEAALLDIQLRRKTWVNRLNTKIDEMIQAISSKNKGLDLPINEQYNCNVLLHNSIHILKSVEQRVKNETPLSKLAAYDAIELAECLELVQNNLNNATAENPHPRMLKRDYKAINEKVRRLEGKPSYWDHFKSALFKIGAGLVVIGSAGIVASSLALIPSLGTSTATALIFTGVIAAGLGLMYLGSNIEKIEKRPNASVLPALMKNINQSIRGIGENKIAQTKERKLSKDSKQEEYHGSFENK